MRSLYATNRQYDQALIAFDRVLEQFPDNPMRKDAQFRKAEQLESLGKRADAAREFDSFAKQYPGDEKTPVALARSKELRAPAPAKQKAASKSKGK
jgi:TolA-binding protein